VYYMFRYIGPNPLDTFLEFGQCGIFIIPQLSLYAIYKTDNDPNKLKKKYIRAHAL
jgi:hypothetical protein